MSSEKTSKAEGSVGKPKKGSRDGRSQPEWANGLKRMYDSVVEEDIPDSFKDLLSQLDAKD